MPSRSNPNVPNKQPRIANRAKVQKKRATNRIEKKARGSAETLKSGVLYPTSGPLKPVSGKKARKLERARNHARQRAMEEEMLKQGEVQMTDAPTTTTSNKKQQEKPKETTETMEVDMIE